MTLPNERVRSVLGAKKLLQDLCDRSYRPNWTELRRRAGMLLRHYPGSYDLSNWGKAEKEEARKEWERD